MEQRCPLCQIGRLEEIVAQDGHSVIQCSAYPACRFTADTWEKISQTVARFHHPVTPGR
ncbi:hypothetical protein [Sulfobacillus harzensis]|uniref:DNA topoisomerase type IA zn finger domain-containing protein n=1 Tax=Sulfobacillus harzensis TaxID=2729629 RepID=A0A7Y0L571_9FIRM|nr:hypothetical protein [Sulfobacillus harzensis]NMP23466.1 hypothetical protein [Sulfobacillus harzensis]